MIQKLLKSSGLRQSLLVAVGNVGASGFSAISLIILSRFLGPERFGGFSVAFSLSQLVARIGDLGLNVSLQKYAAQNYRDRPQLAAAAVKYVGLIKIGVAIIAALLGVGLGNRIGSLVFRLSDPNLAVLGIALASVIVMYEFSVLVLQATGKFGASVAMNAIQAITKCLLAILSLLFLVPNAAHSYLWYGLAPLTAVLVGWQLVPANLKRGANSIASVRRPIWMTAKFSAIAVLAAAIGDNIDVLMVKSWLSEYQTGLYAAASRVSLMVMLFGLSFGTVFNTRAAQYKHQRHLSNFLAKGSVFAVGSLLLIPLAVLMAKPLILITAGAGFLDAIPSMNILMAAAFITMASMPFVAVFYAVEYPAYFAIAGVLQTIVLIGLNLLLIPTVGIEGAAWAKMVTRLVITVYSIITALFMANKQFAAKVPSISHLVESLKRNL